MMAALGQLRCPYFRAPTSASNEGESLRFLLFTFTLSLLVWEGFTRPPGFTILDEFQVTFFNQVISPKLLRR